MAYDHITKDLCRKATQDAKEVVDRISALLPDPADKMMVAVSAAAGPLASAAGFICALIERDTGEPVERDAAIDALWEMVRPVVLSSAGGSKEPFLALLAQTATPPARDEGGL